MRRADNASDTLLVADIGNTTSVFGMFRGAELAAHWRLSTQPERAADEYGVVLTTLFESAGLELGGITGACISTVVPPAQRQLEEFCSRWLQCRPIVVGPGVKTGLSILYDNPREVGADRIVNAVAAFTEYGGPLIIVDFGTATTFCAVSERAEYLGGVIAPGLVLGAEALSSGRPSYRAFASSNRQP